MLEITQFKDESVWYVPDVEDNREKPEAEQFAVLVIPMTKPELRKFEEQTLNAGKKKINFFKRYHRIRERILTKCILEVKNCRYVEIKGGERIIAEVTDGAHLVKIAGEEILEDIVGAIKEQSRLDEGLLGKSVLPSDSCDSEGENETGDVPSAIPQSTQTIPAISEPKIQSYDYEIKTSDGSGTVSQTVIRDSM